MLIIHLTIGIEFDTEYKQQEVISLPLYDPLHLTRSERNLWWRDAALDFHKKSSKISIDIGSTVVILNERACGWKLWPLKRAEGDKCANSHACWLRQLKT